MALSDLIANLYQQAGYLQAGGGERPLSQQVGGVIEGLGKVGEGVNTYQDQETASKLKKAQMQNLLAEANYKQSEAEKNNAANVPLAQTLITPQVNAQLGQAFEKPVPVEDLISGNLNTLQNNINTAKDTALQGQAKYGNLNPGQYKELQSANALGGGFVDKFTGEPTLPTNPNALPVAAKTQADAALRLTLEKKKEQNQAQLSPQAKTYWANVMAAGGNVPSVGMGPAAAKNRLEIMNEAADIATKKGDNATALMLKQAEYSAAKSSLSNLEKTSASIGSFINAAKLNGQRVLDILPKLDPGRYPFLNSLALAGKTQIAGDAVASDYLLRLNTFIREYNRATETASGNGTIAHAAEQELAEALSKASNAETMKALIDTGFKDMDSRSTGFEQTRQEIAGHVNNLQTQNPSNASPGLTPQQQETLKRLQVK